MSVLVNLVSLEGCEIIHVWRMYSGRPPSVFCFGCM